MSQASSDTSPHDSPPMTESTSPEIVTRFHAAGLAAGGFDDGAPGRRPHYAPGYFAAFLRDPDGNKIEAMCWIEADTEVSAATGPRTGS